MALEGMHRELLGHLQAKCAAQLLISDWETAWHDRLGEGAASDTLSPCPECFLKRRMSKLNPFPSHGASGQARCSRCGTVFVFLDG